MDKTYWSTTTTTPICLDCGLWNGYKCIIDAHDRNSSIYPISCDKYEFKKPNETTRKAMQEYI